MASRIIVVVSSSVPLLFCALACPATIGLALGCSSGTESGRPSTAQQSAGTSGTGSGDSGSGGGGGDGGGGDGNATAGGSGAEGGAGAVGAMGLGEICFQYVMAACARSAECEGDLPEPDCLDSARFCPDLLFSAGSSLTPAGVTACSEEWRSFDCALVNSGHYPDCFSAGQVEPGEPCAYSTQCSSLRCTGNVDACGACASVAEPGGTCNPDDGPFCPSWQICDAGTCVDRDLPELGSGDGPRHDEGADCVNDADCLPDLYCAFRDDRPELGECAVAPGAGEPCADQHVRGSNQPTANACDGESYCGMDVVCHARPPAGEPCGLAQFNGTLHCADGAFCDTGSDMCVEVQPAGTACSYHEQCDAQAGLTCVCDGPMQVTTYGPCPSDIGTCLLVLEPGADCSASENPICGFGSSCVDGVCSYDPAPSDFDTLCK